MCFEMDFSVGICPADLEAVMGEWGKDGCSNKALNKTLLVKFW